VENKMMKKFVLSISGFYNEEKVIRKIKKVKRRLPINVGE